MPYDHEEETDLIREYDMIYTLFHGAEDEDRRQRAGEEQQPCECPPPEDGIAVRILKFLFGERSLDPEEHEEHTRPYHRHIHQPAHSAQVNDLGSKVKPDSKRWNRKRLYSQSAIIQRDMGMPGTEPPYGNRPMKAEALLRLVTAVLCAAAIIVFSSTSSTLSRIKNWFLNV